MRKLFAVLSLTNVVVSIKPNYHLNIPRRNQVSIDFDWLNYAFYYRDNIGDRGEYQHYIKIERRIDPDPDEDILYRELLKLDLPGVIGCAPMMLVTLLGIMGIAALIVGGLL